MPGFDGPFHMGKCTLKLSKLEKIQELVVTQLPLMQETAHLLDLLARFPENVDPLMV